MKFPNSTLFPDIGYRRTSFVPSPVLPMTRREMEQLGWDHCDIILVTGDAYIDHPAFGAAIIGRILEAHGFRVGVIAQPDMSSQEAFLVLGSPALFFGVTSGNLDSMVANYTADKLPRSDDAFTPGNHAGSRPDRAIIAYCQRLRALYKKTPVIIGGIEASLRRFAHYDYWSETVRHSVLIDSQAHMLVWGSGEQQVVEIAHRLDDGKQVGELTDIPGTAFVRGGAAMQPFLDKAEELPSFQEVKTDPELFWAAEKRVHVHALGGDITILAQRHGPRAVFVLPPARPLMTAEMDKVYELPFSRRPHPAYGRKRIPAYETTRFSITIMRGCCGGCTFCALTNHQGRIIQSRSHDSVCREIELIRDTIPGFTGFISDLGGPTANMYNTVCALGEKQANCRRLSCLYPAICRHLRTDHTSLVKLYRRTRSIKGINFVGIGSGIRHDLALQSGEYIRELTKHHVSGHLKIAPEHISPHVLALMRKPLVESFEEFKKLFNQYSKEAGKEQYILPYFIAAHPGTTDEDMVELALYLKRTGIRVDQVQTFLPAPMSLATAMYYTGLNLLGRKCAKRVHIPRNLSTRRLHKALLRYHDPDNWPVIREALRRMEKAELIGTGKECLVPPYQPRGKGKTKKYRAEK